MVVAAGGATGIAETLGVVVVASLAVELEKAVKAALKRDYDTATLHSLTLGHGGGDMPEESWASMLDFSMVDSS